MCECCGGAYKGFRGWMGTAQDGGRIRGSEADGVAVQCPNEKCDGTQAYFYQLQIRSADEPMTTFYKVSGLLISTC